ncbi:OadG family protein [Thermodesulforhabdus norvegica]|uniref:Oxaloacetate decarboxylase, gamma chain n=1 Tax=Thermodesulforhabdus norvegica TaxID=39841 RepID=A0A1I4TXC6_9BACT|nr:OadG family protein [Thermodesulforhabdus norvegica]SFM81448.1 Oxaloacetate decarboxylase, gamma chain [Thermodesulforhabdus norvegica]
MYGLKAIQEAHGWTITFLGVSVVFSALAFLSLFVANLSRILNFLDVAKRSILERLKSKPEVLQEAPAPQGNGHREVRIWLSPHDHEMMRYFELITQKLGEPFSLEEVLEKAQDRGIPRPHSALYNLIKKGVIVECRDKAMGYYCWKRGIDIAVSSDDKSPEREVAAED